MFSLIKLTLDYFYVILIFLHVGANNPLLIAKKDSKILAADPLSSNF